MARINVFADESGNLDFSRKKDASRYFILTTVTSNDFAAGDALLRLRRELAWEDMGLVTELHATSDEQVVRDKVFKVICAHPLRIDVTILEKCKAAPHVRPTEERFYKMAWFLHMKHVAPLIVTPHDELFVVSASLGVKKKRSLMHSAVVDVINQVSPTVAVKTACWQAHSDPCLQVADYCSWAVGRKWERDDARSYDLIRGMIRTEFDAFRIGKTEYY